MADSGLDAEKLDVLRTWGRGLQRDERQEVSAAGRAILLLIEEIERLHVVLWERRLYPPAEPESDLRPEPPLRPEPAGETADGEAPALEAGPGAEELSSPLRDRLRRFVGRPGAVTESTGEAPEA